MKLRSWQKDILSMVVIIGLGFILFNIAFILAFFVQTACNMIIKQFVVQIGSTSFLNDLWHYMYLILILVLSWFVFKTRLNDLLKATFSTMPMIVVLTEVGVQFHDKPPLVWAINTVILGAILFYLYKTKRFWLYYFATIYVAVVEIFAMLSGMEI